MVRFLSFVGCFGGSFFVCLFVCFVLFLFFGFYVDFVHFFF